MNDNLEMDGHQVVCLGLQAVILCDFAGCTVQLPIPGCAQALIVRTPQAHGRHLR